MNTPTGTTAAPIASDCNPYAADDLDHRAVRNDLLTTIQPGGGFVMTMELAWGRLRRTCLRIFRPGYVTRMETLRRGELGSIPIVPVDSRDVKFYRNQTAVHWDPADDPFDWRNRLPFVRDGLAELIVLGGGSLLVAALLAMVWWPLAIAMLPITFWIGWFFRNPPRAVPVDAGTVVSPADGKLVTIESVDDPEWGRCLRMGIFLSIFNVHANRSSVAGEVVDVRYRPGKMLNALRDESARENENLDLILRPDDHPDRLCMIRQITGQFARRIVCGAKVGDRLERGEMYGMIKLGSRTELMIPDDGRLTAVAAVGDKVIAGETVMARYEFAGGGGEAS